MDNNLCSSQADKWGTPRAGGHSKAQNVTPRSDEQSGSVNGSKRKARGFKRAQSAVDYKENHNQTRIRRRPSTANGLHNRSSAMQIKIDAWKLSRQRSTSVTSLAPSYISKSSGYRSSFVNSGKTLSTNSGTRANTDTLICSKDRGISLSTSNLNANESDETFSKSDKKSRQRMSSPNNQTVLHQSDIQLPINSENDSHTTSPTYSSKGELTGSFNNTDTADVIVSQKGEDIPDIKDLNNSIEDINNSSDDIECYTHQQKSRVTDIVNTWYKYGVHDKLDNTTRTKPRFGLKSHPHYWSSVKGKKKDTAEIIKEKRTKARQLFHWAYKLVRNILHYQRILISVSSDLTVWSAVESQWHALHVSSEAKKLVFNKDNFAQNKALMRMPRWAKMILDKQPNNRTEEDCRKLHAMLRGHLKNFDKFTEKIQLAMCRAFMYYRVKPMRVIIRQGHTGLYFYFIYSGSVFVNLSDVNEKGQQFTKTEAVLSRGDSFGEVALFKQVPHSASISSREECEPLVEDKEVFSREVALLKQVPRSASISSREECELLVVDKEVFSRVCPRIFDIELEEKHNFVRKIPVFHHKYWSEEAIKKICFEAQIQQYKTGKVISQSSASDEWMYICMEGSGRVIKCLALNETTESSNQRKQLDSDTATISISSIETERLKKIEKKQIAEDDTFNNNRSGKSPIKRKNSTVKFSENTKSKSGLTRRKSRASILNSAKSSGNLQIKRDQMYNSMNVNYNFKPLTQAHVIFSQNQCAEELANRLINNRNVNKQQSGVMTLTGLINSNRDLYQGACEFIYLDIGSLAVGEIFDLAELLAPSDPFTKSSLVLVSSGCQVFRVKKQVVMDNITSQTTEHVKYLARNSMYPSKAVLIKSFHEKEEWDNYKSTVLKHAVRPYTHLKRHKHVVSHNRTLLRQQSARVIRSLKSENQEDRDFALEEVINENALMYKDNIHGEFESRMLNDATAINDKLLMKPLMPDVSRRTSPLAGRALIITPSNTRYGGVGEVLS